MKNQIEELSIDQFRLQITKLKKEEQDLGLNKQDSSTFSIYNIQELPISISNLSPWVYFSLQYLWIVHITFCYLFCFQKVYQKGLTWTVSLLNYVKVLNTISNIINTSMLALIIISIIFQKTKKEEGLISIFGFIGAKIYPFLRYLIYLCFYFTSIFALNAQAFNITLFFLSCLVELIKSGFLLNFTLRKDYFCCKSAQFILFHRFISITSISLGIISVNNVTKESEFLIFVIIQAILGLVTIVCYFSFGIYTFRHKVPRWLFFFLNVSYCCITLAMLFNLMQALGSGSFNFYTQAFFVLLVVIHLSYNTLDRKRRLSQIPQNKNLKQKIFFLFNKFESCDIDNQDDAQIRGIINFHHICGCDNINCVVNFQEVYDSKKKKYCSVNKIAQSRVSLVKFYVKCLLQTALRQDPQNIEIILDYLQFYYLKLKNVFVVLKLIIELQKKLLSPIQRLRLVRLKRILKLQNNSFAEDLFMGKLSMQKIISAQQTFQNLLKGIDFVLFRNELFWRYLSRNEVFLADILQATKSNFSLIDRLDLKWYYIANYFDINRIWKFYFLFFTIYIKNQKLKPSIYQEFGNSVEYESIFKSQNYFIDKTTEKEALFNPILLFEQDTCYIVANCDQEKMQIKRVSNYFSHSFDYQPNQIVGSHLHDLMPPSIRSFHHKMFVSWAKEGKSHNQHLYSIKKVTPLTKKGFLAPSFKFYKYYVLNSGQIEYIAMLKRNKKQQMIILTNDKFQIEAITFGLAQKIRIASSQEYPHLLGTNLLIFIPMLAKYTHYAKYIKQNDQDFLQNDENQTYFKKQNTSIFGGIDQSPDLLGIKKQLNLTNLKFIFPNDFESIKSLMKNRSKEKQDDFAVIRECYLLMRKKKNFLKFKGEISISQKNYAPYSTAKFYEIEIIELEQNNRLQKLKLQEQKMEQLNEVKSNKEIESNSFMQVDMQMFLQLNNKRNKIVLFPSDNIFIKQESNHALTQISHIENINITMRFVILLLITILFAILIIEISVEKDINVLNTEFYWISDHQKMIFLLNSQYNIQQIQPGNAIQQSFYIVFYTHSIIHASQNTQFQLLLYNTEVNPPSFSQPYFRGKYPYPILENITCLPQDQVSIFEYLFQSLITLHRMAERDPTDRLESQQYHIFNNYIYSYYEKTQDIKINIKNKYQSISNRTSSTISWFGISQVILIIFCFLFSFSRIVKVTNGFYQLTSIFIQMDNNDIKKIGKFVSYVIKLFDHLKEKYNKIRQNRQLAAASSSYIRQLQKSSSELGNTQVMMTASIGANLNKKIKKLEVGNQILNINKKALCLIGLYLFLLGITLSIPVIYSLISLSKLSQLQNMGFSLIGNTSVPNAIATGIIQKFRNAQIYRDDKYSPFFKIFSDITQTNVFVTLSTIDNDFGKLIKLVYFDDFCRLRTDVFNTTFKDNLEQTCGRTTDISRQSCQVLFQTINDQAILNRCQTIQGSFLNKGVVYFYNYLLNRGLLYFNNGSDLTLRDVVEINDALKIIAVFDVYLIQTWLSSVRSTISARIIILVIVIMSSFICTLILHFFFIQVLLKNYLNQKYQVFRRMHEYLIPEFVINKQKIIKAKLIKQGFMKQ